MFAVVYLIPNENKITFTDASNEISIILRSFFFSLGKYFKENGIKNIEAIKNLKKVKLKDGISFSAIFPKTPVAPPKTEAKRIKRII